jgi:hypothetical protein
MSAHVELVILRHEVAELRRKLAEAKAELEQFKDGLANLEELHATKSKMEAHIKQHPALRVLVARTFASMVADSPNYTEAKFNIRDTEDWITVTVQKANGKTPHEKRLEAEANCEQLRRDNLELAKRLQLVKAP